VARPGHVRIRPASDCDVADIVDLLNQHDPSPQTEGDFRRWLGTLSPRLACRPFVALVGSGELVGFAIFQQTAINAPIGHYFVHLKVHETHRCQGVGARLWHQMTLEASRVSAKGLYTFVREDDQPSRVWAERRGFAVGLVRHESVLDVDAFAERRVGEQARERARRCPTDTTIHDMSRYWIMGAEWTRLAGVFARLFGDSPGVPSPANTSFEEYFERTWIMNSRLDSRAFFVADHRGKWVGTAFAIRMREHQPELWSQFTGVLPEFRGTGLAYALKLRTILYAAANGFRQMRAFNLSGNDRMLAINDAFGFQRVPGLMWMIRG